VGYLPAAEHLSTGHIHPGAGNAGGRGFKVIEKTTLERVGEETMRFMRGKYLLDEGGNGADELKFRRGGKTVLTVYIREDRYDFTSFSARRRGRRSSGSATVPAESGISTTTAGPTRRERDADHGRQLGRARDGHAFDPAEKSRTARPSRGNRRSGPNAACDAICASTIRAARSARNSAGSSWSACPACTRPSRTGACAVPAAATSRRTSCARLSNARAQEASKSAWTARTIPVPSRPSSAANSSQKHAGRRRHLGDPPVCPGPIRQLTDISQVLTYCMYSCISDTRRPGPYGRTAVLRLFRAERPRGRRAGLEIKATRARDVGMRRPDGPSGPTGDADTADG
jgi:hypothetical protein